MRQDGYWELLAASVGTPRALARVLTGLSREQLEQAARSDEITPSLVRERVEALAAFDPRLLADLAGSWRSPAEIRGDPFWQAAWGTALRHLRELDLFSEMATRAPELAAEVAIIGSTPAPEARSWSQLIHKYKSQFIPYDTLRMWANLPLSDSAISVRAVEAAPLLLLRILRGREQLLDSAARNHLRSVAVDALALDPLESALLLEIVRRFDTNVIAVVREGLVQLLPALLDARVVIPLAYLLVSPHWIAP
jgi:hypothetical protein